MKNMVEVYVALIVRGLKKFSQVPSRIKEQVRQRLIELELNELTVE